MNSAHLLSILRLIEVTLRQIRHFYFSSISTHKCGGNDVKFPTEPKWQENQYVWRIFKGLRRRPQKRIQLVKTETCWEEFLPFASVPTHLI